GVVRAAEAGDLCVDACATGECVLFTFDEERAGAFAGDETITREVEGAACGGGVLAFGGEGAHDGEAGEAEFADTGFAATGNGDFGAAGADEHGGFADSLGTRRAGGDDGPVVAAQAVLEC